MKLVKIFTDGACKGNPGPGGWGAILKFNGNEKVISGGEQSTTNNRMEILGVINALRLLKEKCKVELVSDSKYVCDAIEKGWARRWKENNWMRNKHEPALNVDLWEELINLLDIHDVSVHWIKGHAGHEENERCDKLAVNEAKKYMNLNYN